MLVVMRIIISLALLGGGLFLVVASLYVEARHEQIWNRYRKQYKNPDSSLEKLFTGPHEFVYKFNVYVLWPACFVLGLFTAYNGVRALVIG